jgi:hypothetical protein
MEGNSMYSSPKSQIATMLLSSTVCRKDIFYWGVYFIVDATKACPLAAAVAANCDFPLCLCRTINHQ